MSSFAAALMLLAQAQISTTPGQESRITSSLSVAVEQMIPRSSCIVEKPLPSDLLIAIGSYLGASIPTVTIAGQEKSTSLADVAIGRGKNPIYLVLSSHDPVIWRLTGDMGRIRRLVIFHQQEAGVIGIPRRKIRFEGNADCKLFYDNFEERTLEQEVPVLAIFGRRANLIGGEYGLYRASVTGDALQIDRTLSVGDHDLILNDPPGDTVFPKARGNGPSTLEIEFHRNFPAGIVEVDPHKVIATGAVETYAVLPETAGALQLEQSGALVPATAADVRRWKDRAVISGHVPADRVRGLYFYSAYRVTRPIRLPAGLCGGFSMTFFVPSRDFVKGDPCHSNIYVDDGSIMAGDYFPGD
ncbi:MAG TPA: hypothetical protein VK485_08260 [Sphingomicrobium sp.]|nr:hypothetical protein [Sphingomicrobium sp.]